MKKGMTLDEAIAHCEEVMMENIEETKGRNASDPVAHNCFECADNHRQLAEWLKALRKAKVIIDIDNSVIQEDVIKYKLIQEVVNKALGEVEQH